MADSSLKSGLSATALNDEKAPSTSTVTVPRSSIEEKPLVQKTRPYSGFFGRRSLAMTDGEGTKSRPYSGYFGRRKSAIIEEEETKEVKAPEVPPVSFSALFRCVEWLLLNSAAP
jgi:hypothetical protein